jgi:hypothetical protein
VNAGLKIPDEIICHGVAPGPFYIMICEFENRAARFYMGERKRVKLDARFDQLIDQFSDCSHFVYCDRLLCTLVFLRFARQNHILSLLAEALASESQMASVASENQKAASLLQGIFEDILSERSIADAVIDAELGMVDVDRGGEEEDEQEDEDEFFQAEVEDRVRHFDPERSMQQVADYELEINVVREQDSATGLFDIGCPLISDYGERSGWSEPKITACIQEFVLWLDNRRDDVVQTRARGLPPPLFWIAIGTSSQWNVLRECAEVIILSPASEAENERRFSIRKYVLGDRGGRTRNDFLAFRVRLRMGRDQEHINQERIEH